MWTPAIFLYLGIWIPVGILHLGMIPRCQVLDPQITISQEKPDYVYKIGIARFQDQKGLWSSTFLYVWEVEISGFDQGSYWSQFGY